MISKKYISGIVSQGISILVPFIITFISIRELNASDSGSWLLFLTTSAFLPLLDFGISPSIVRNISYVMSGANKLSKTGCTDIEVREGMNLNLLGQLIFDIRKLYRRIGLVGGFVIFSIGIFYFYNITVKEYLVNTLIAWAVFSFGLFLSLYYLYCNPLLIGFERIIESNIANIAAKLIWLFFTIFFIVVDSSNLLIKLAVSFSLSVLIYRYILIYFLNKVNAYKKGCKLRTEEPLLGIILHNAIKLGIVGVGSFLISRASIFIIGAYLPIFIAGEYALSMQVIFAIMAVSQVALAIRVPTISRLRAEKNTGLLIKEIKIAFLSAGGVFIFGMFIFILINQPFIDFIHSNMKFLASNLLILITVVYFLELMHSISATIITTGNHVPFVIPSIISGCAVLFFTFYILEFTKLNVLGVILVQGVVQLLYNNWKWPLVLYRELKSLNQ